MGAKKFKQSEIDSVRPADIARIIAWSVLILVLFIGVLSLAYKTKRSLKPVEYEGKIVDKWAGYNHSDEGSFPYFRLLVETDSGQKLTVEIDRDNYARAKVGTRIKKTPKGIELAKAEPTNGSASTPWSVAAWRRLYRPPGAAFALGRILST